MASHHPIRKSVKPAAPQNSPEIPDKLYFRIGDVARLLDLPAYVLRFWETEFPQLKPNKGGTGQRLYRRKDVETAMRIKELLYGQGYTIPGARQALRSESESSGPSSESVILSGARSAKEDAVILSEARSAEPKDPARASHTHAADTISTTNPALLTLRDELRALSAQLSRPVAAAPLEEKIKPIRPRAVASSGPKAVPPLPAKAEKSEPHSSLDLFPNE
jgi:DNA-binding transcriptional MerR regulator